MIDTHALIELSIELHFWRICASGGLIARSNERHLHLHFERGRGEMLRNFDFAKLFPSYPHSALPAKCDIARECHGWQGVMLFFPLLRKLTHLQNGKSLPLT